MSTQNKSLNENLNPKEFLTTLQKLNSIDSYQQLGFILNSLCKVTQTALMAEQEYKNETLCHNPLDIYNIFSIIQTLLPNNELELLDLINKE